MPFDFQQASEPIRIIGAKHTISPSEIAAVLKSRSGDTRLAVEHILSILKTSEEKYSPKSFINTPETALQTLEVLFQGHEDIFDLRDISQVKKLVLGIMSLLAEYYGNSQKYNSHISRDPEEQKELYQAQQKLTDIFHFIVGNIIDRNFEVEAQLGDIEIGDIIQDEAVLQYIEISSDFPNIQRILGTFTHIDFGDKTSIQETKQAA